MSWLALYLPDLPLEAIVDAGPAANPPKTAGQQPPLCVLEGGRVIAISRESKAVGAHIGMTLAAASSLTPGLLAIPRDPRRESALLQRLALALSCYTPSLQVEADGLLLELSATLRLFGGAAPLRRSIQDTVRCCGIERPLFTQAATAAAASILVRLDASQSIQRAEATRTRICKSNHGSAAGTPALTHQRLDELPLETVLPVWRQPPALAELLQGIGCRTLGELRALPRSGLTRRGGRELMSLVARAYGDEPDPPAWYEPPPNFELGLELLHRADAAEALVFAAQRLVQPLAGWLAARWLAASRLLLVLRHETSRHHDHPDSVLEIALAEPSRDAAQIMLLLRERLQRMTLPAPVCAIVLRLDSSVSHAGRAGTLWASPTSQRESERVLIDRLSARLGSDRVQRMQLCADHRPEHATRWVSAQSFADDNAAARAIHGRAVKGLDKGVGEGANRANVEPAPPPRSARPDGLPPKPKPPARSEPRSEPPPTPQAPRPTWLLGEPLPLHEDRGRPVHEGKALSIISRAERIESGWFDGALASRDYHVAASDDCCYWIYRERRAGAPARWFLHGIFG